MCVNSLSLSRMFKDRDLKGKGEKGKFERVNKRDSFCFNILYKLSKIVNILPNDKNTANKFFLKSNQQKKKRISSPTP